MESLNISLNLGSHICLKFYLLYFISFVYFEEMIGPQLFANIVNKQMQRKKILHRT